jgi:CDGSH-type Zn-finger protein
VVGESGVVTVRRYPRGPALVRGASHLVDADGIEIPCVRRTVAVCVCGASRLGAMCDGTHRFVLEPTTRSDAELPSP